MNIFLVEDDEKLRDELSDFLEAYGYECQTSTDFENIIDIILDRSPDLILLDVNLPYNDGYDICKQIRKKSNVPIIIVTSRNTDLDELKSMNIGADDFVTKPYNTQVLLARIKARLKNNFNSEIIEYRGLKFYPERGQVVYNNIVDELTKNEMKILSTLISNRRKIVSRDELMDALWQTDEFVDDNTLTVNVNRLRKKLESLGLNEFIVTKRGQGYIV